MRISWDEYFIEMAKLISKRSTCLRRQVGALAVRENIILSTGYNGAPKKHEHCLDTGCLRDKLKIKSGEQQEICKAVHAEMNVLCQAACTGVSLKNSILYCTHQPCSICARLIVNSGIKKVYYLEGYPDKLTKEILKFMLFKLEI